MFYDLINFSANVMRPNLFNSNLQNKNFASSDLMKD